MSVTADTNSPAERRTSILILAYLAPFYLVRSLNVAPWFKSEGRTSANITNGIVILCVLDMAVIHLLWVTVAMPLGADYPTSPFFPVAIYILFCASHLAWLTTRRVKLFSSDFQRLSWPMLAVVVAASLAFFGVALISFFLATPLRS